MISAKDTELLRELARRVDEIAAKNGVPFNDPKRIRGAIFASLD